MIKAVIFDMDGVIINSEPLHYEVDKLLLHQEGFPVEDSYLDQFVGLTNPAMWALIKEDLSLNTSIEKLIKQQISLKMVLLEKRNYKAIDGIPELMGLIRSRNMALGLASSSPMEFIEGVLKKLNLIDIIEAWESGERVEKSKPAPDIFLHVAAMLNVAPEDSLVIEDSYSGVKAAKAAGMKCIGYRNPHSGNQDLSEADRIVEKITDIGEEDFLC